MEIRIKTSYKLSAQEVFDLINRDTVFQLSTEDVKITLLHSAPDGALHQGSILDVSIKGMKAPLKFVVTSCKIPDRVILHTREDSPYKGEWYIDFVSTTSGCNIREKLILHPNNLVSRLKLFFIKEKVIQAYKSKSLEQKSRLLQNR